MNNVKGLKKMGNRLRLQKKITEMGNRKFSKSNKEKRVNTIIEIRKEILEMLRDLNTDLGWEVTNPEDRAKIDNEVREIAKIISSKDAYMEKAHNQAYTKHMLFKTLLF